MNSLSKYTIVYNSQYISKNEESGWCEMLVNLPTLGVVLCLIPTHVGKGKDRSKALLWRNFYVLWRITLSNACKLSKISIAEIKRDGARAYPT